MQNQLPMTEATFYILLALTKPSHGYGMMQRIRALSDGRIQMGPGTLYGVLTRMNREGLIRLAGEDGRRKNCLCLLQMNTIRPRTSMQSGKNYGKDIRDASR